MLIYKITNLKNGKCYIGQTIKTIKKRWRRHCLDAREGYSSLIIHNAIRKYTPDGFSIEQIDTSTSQEELNKKEAYWIKECNSMYNKNGYNMMESDNRAKVSDVVLNKIKKKAQNRWVHKFKGYLYDKTKPDSLGNLVGVWDKISTCAKDLEINKPGITKVLNGHSISTKGYVFRHEDDSLLKIAHPKESEPFKVFHAVIVKKGVVEKGEYVDVWSSRVKCINDLSHNVDVGGVLRGEIAQSGGFIFEYINEEMRSDTHNKLLNKIKVGAHRFTVHKAIKMGGGGRTDVCYKKGECVGVWDTISQCSKDLDIGINLKYVLNGNALTYRGFIFEYVDEKLKEKANMNIESRRMKNRAKKIAKSRPFTVIGVGSWWFPFECAEDLAIDAKCVRQCLSSAKKTHKGYVFEYIENNNI